MAATRELSNSELDTSLSIRESSRCSDRLTLHQSESTTKGTQTRSAASETNKSVGQNTVSADASLNSQNRLSPCNPDKGRVQCDLKSLECSSCPSVQSASTRPGSPCSSAYNIPLPLQNVHQVQHECMSNFNMHRNPYQPLFMPPNAVSHASNFIQPCLHETRARQDLLHPQMYSRSVPQLPTSGQSCFNYPFGMQGFPTASFQCPQELSYPGKISVGDSKCLTLSILNNQSLCPCYQISCVSSLMNKESVSLEFIGLQFPSMIQRSCGPSTDVQLTLSPRCEGKFEVLLQIAAFSNRNDLSMATMASPLQTKIVYEAIMPSISISSQGRSNLDIGQVIAGSTVIENITISNNCDAAVPLYIRLSMDLQDNYLGFAVNQMSNDNYPATAEKKLLSPKVLFLRLPSTGSSDSQFDVPIVFQAGDRDTEANFTLTANVETPTLNECIGVFRVSASVGKADLVMTTAASNRLVLSAILGSTSDHILKVMNQSAFPVVYDVMIEGEESEVFTVLPSTLSLKPMERADLSIAFCPSTVKVVKGHLKAAAQPHGRLYDIAELIGDGKHAACNAASSSRRPSSVRPALEVRETRSAVQDASRIQCNKKYLSWGGADVGLSVVKTFTLRNPSNMGVKVKLFIQETPQRTFKLLDEQNRTSKHFTTEITAKENKTFSVLFCPSRVAASTAVLVIKTLLEGDRKHFSIPLSGYGGTGKLRVSEASITEGVGHCLNVYVPPERRPLFNNITVHNDGERAMFVKVLAFSRNVAANSPIEQVFVRPSEFVLLENENKTLLMSSIMSENPPNVSDCGIVTFLYGDELVRQKLRRDNNASQTLFQEVNFNVPFTGEERVSYDSTYEGLPDVSSLFRSSLKTFKLHLIASQNVSVSESTFDPLSTFNFDATFDSIMSTRRLTTAADMSHSPPVKDFTAHTLNRLSMPLSPDFRQMPSQPEAARPEPTLPAPVECWTIKPEVLTIDGSNRDNRVLLINLSNQDLRFKIGHAVDVVSVSPLCGLIPAKGQLGLRVTGIPYSIAKLSEDYQSNIKVVCGTSEKSFVVKILKDMRKSKDITSSLERSLEPDSLQGMQLETYVDRTLVGATSSGDRSLARATSHIVVRKINDFPKDIVMNTTPPGKTSETVIRVQNVEKYAVQWSIDMSLLLTESLEDPLRGHIIHITPTSGTLKSMEKTRIVIKFTPTRPDVYSKFCEFTMKSEKGRKENCRFKIVGKCVVLNEQNLESGRSSTACVKKSSKDSVFVDSEELVFPNTVLGQNSQVHICVKNPTTQDVQLSIIKPQSPFGLTHSSVTVRSKKYLKIAVMFKPVKDAKRYEDVVILHSELGYEFVIKLKGLACLK